MARPLRLEFPGALYHLTSRGNERRPIFRSDIDRNTFLRFLGQTAIRFGWSVTAFVLMSNHFHLLIQTPEPNLSRGMHWLNGRYAAWFNHRHARSGHLFQGRFHAFLIEKESYFAEVLRYVVLNPVRAKMVERPDQYRWSSYRATAGMESPPEWLDLDSIYRSFGRDEETARAAYREFVQERVESEQRLSDLAINAIYLGTEAWACKMRRRVEAKPRSTDHPKAHRAVGRPSMSKVLQTIARQAKLSYEAIRSRRAGPLRRLVAWLGWNEGLLTLRAIAASLRLRSEGYVSALIRRCDREFRSDGVLLQHLDEALISLRI